MPDYRTFFDKEYLYSFHLDGRDVTVTIEKYKGGKIGHENKKQSKLLLYFKGKQKPLACNVTNGGIIAQLYGKNVDAWVGKLVTLFPTTTTFGKDTVDCIRVRPWVPGKNGKPVAVGELNEHAAPPDASDDTSEETEVPTDDEAREILEAEKRGAVQ